MRRVKEEEKSMGPMFPRLHVNDTAEKGGPRAPPRNKMALYEQLSIPSQRFGSGLNPHNRPGLVSSTSSSQGSGVERNLSIPGHLHQSTPMPWPEKIRAHHSDGADGTAMALGQLEQRKKAGDGNEFAVPVFVKARAGHGKIQHSTDRESVSSISSSRSGRPVGRENTSDVVPENNVSTDCSFGREARRESNANVEAGKVISAANQSTPEDVDGCMREVEASVDREHDGSNFSRSHGGGSGIRGDDVIESTRDKPRLESHCVQDLSKDDKPVSNGKHNHNSGGTCISLRLERVDNSDDVSQTSMLESVFGSDIAPDDVVEIIGQKHFWKARSAIVNQQRVFAIQVFELHRLVKVQKLIAGSPDLLIENSAFMQKSSLECSPVSKIPPKIEEKPSAAVANCKDDSEKPSPKAERSPENVVVKTPISSTKNGDQFTNNAPHVTNPQPMVATTDNKMDPWCFHQPPGPQWLVPMMSPSEGLVYKPYQGPGLPGPVYGGCGPFGPTPAVGNHLHTLYGIQASQHQESWVFPGTSPAGHTLFPPYCMPYTNPDMSGLAGERSHSQTGPIPRTGASLNVEQQSSCNAPNPRKNVSVSQASKFRASKGSDLLLGSTGSSHSERADRVGSGHNAEIRDPLPLFPVGPVISEGASQSHVADQPTRAIKVVPHSRRSATESATRIFRFIQEERKQYNYA